MLHNGAEPEPLGEAQDGDEPEWEEEEAAAAAAADGGGDDDEWEDVVGDGGDAAQGEGGRRAAGADESDAEARDHLAAAAPPGRLDPIATFCDPARCAGRLRMPVGGPGRTF